MFSFLLPEFVLPWRHLCRGVHGRMRLDSRLLEETRLEGIEQLNLRGITNASLIILSEPKHSRVPGLATCNSRTNQPSKIAESFAEGRKANVDECYAVHVQAVRILNRKLCSLLEGPSTVGLVQGISLSLHDPRPQTSCLQHRQRVLPGKSSYRLLNAEARPCD